jgi:membrane protein YqaA with SNARE-associated domain
MFKRLTEYTRRFAHHRHAEGWLLFYAIIESFFFPVPPDVLLVVLALSRPMRAQRFAFITAVGSVLGGVIGYVIGRYGFSLIAEPVLTWACTHDAQMCPATFLPWLQDLFARHGVWVIAVSALSPIIPYKLSILVAGLAHMAIVPFIVISFIVHWLRYAMVCFLMVRYGRKAADFTQERLQLILTAAGAAVLVIYIVLNYFRS